VKQAFVSDFYFNVFPGLPLLDGNNAGKNAKCKSQRSKVLLTEFHQGLPV